MSSAPLVPRIPALDGLRAFAVLWVVGVHVLYGLPQEGPEWAVLSHLRTGYLGVDVFFTLSGFLITALLLGARRRHGRVDLARFYGRRAARLFPALVIVVGACLAFAHLHPGLNETLSMGPAAAAALGGYANWYQLLAAPYPSSLLSHTWSLAIEAQFYAVWPLVLTAVIAAFRRYAAAAVLLIALVALALSPLLALSGAPGTRLYFGSGTRATNLLLGAALALAVEQGWLRPTRVQRVAWRWAARAAVVGVVAIIIFGDAERRLWADGMFAWVGLGTVAIIGWALVDRGRPSILRGVLESGPAEGLARISYGLYLWHWPVCAVVSASAFEGHVMSVVAVRVGLSLALAIASWWFVESPFLLPLPAHPAAPRPVRTVGAPAPGQASTARATRSVPNAVRIAR